MSNQPITQVTDNGETPALTPPLSTRAASAAAGRFFAALRMTVLRNSLVKCTNVLNSGLVGSIFDSKNITAGAFLTRGSRAAVGGKHPARNCVERVQALQHEFQTDEFTCYFNQGGLIDHAAVRRSMELFAREVIPRCR